MNELLVENRELLQNLAQDALQAIAVLGKFPEILKYVEENEEGEKDMYHALRELVYDKAKELAEEKAKELAEEKAKELAEEMLEAKSKEMEKQMAINHENGIRIFIASSEEEKIPRERILDKLKRWYQISDSEAKKYLAQYAG